jgi:hypothetical protein
VIGLAWPLPDGMDDAELERRLFTPANVGMPCVLLQVARYMTTANTLDLRLRADSFQSLFDCLAKRYPRYHKFGLIVCPDDFSEGQIEEFTLWDLKTIGNLVGPRSSIFLPAIESGGDVNAAESNHADDLEVKTSNLTDELARYFETPLERLANAINGVKSK